MAVSLKGLSKTGRKNTPPRLLIYGPPGLGKSSLAGEFPSPVIIDVEDGVPADMEIATFGEVTGMAMVAASLQQLYSEEHDFKTVIIDSLDKLEPMVWDAVCERHSKDNIEDFGYGKGYLEAQTAWKEAIIDLCNMLRRDKGMTIIYIAHSSISTFEDPQHPSYSTYDIRLHKRASALFQDEVDAIFFINQDITVQRDTQGFNKERTRAEGGGVRWIHTEKRPAFTAKNRFGMPPSIIYNKGEGYSALAPYLPTHGGAK